MLKSYYIQKFEICPNSLVDSNLGINKVSFHIFRQLSLGSVEILQDSLVTNELSDYKKIQPDRN